ncbi:alpha-N-acetylneuraminide alpha-2,8-sialyltransferase-like isoform X2 [Acanthaster planci]|uniref:Alpha-N-acetylneuraminide alpha-2,8-sialyltransferase-like isoform X2 n=1 Tax=Acanthaster planci TaxID=133434 RepID=A0A8B7YWT4_ACAPL|nr:alpha-N-acetylneuraminide alpha-2,8-sialyltransferase-like isoform X2 [Acanthaster planci]
MADKSSSFRPYPARAYGQRRHSERNRHVSASSTKFVTCGNISRWVVLRCKRTLLYRAVFLVCVLPMIAIIAVLRPTVYTTQVEQEKISFNSQVKESTSNSSSSVFSKKYAIHYPENNTEFFIFLRNIMNRSWEYNQNHTEEFRKDLQAALGNKGKLDKFILTKQNTKVGQRVSFLSNGGSMKISKPFWQSLASDTLYRPGLFKRCSVVGSSGILNGSGCGGTIDKGDFIFRFNLADVQNYTEDVGRKTNFTTLNPSFIYEKLNSLTKRADQAKFTGILKQFEGSHLWLPLFAFRWKYRILVKAANFAQTSKHVQPIYGHPEHYSTVASLWQETLNGTYRTSTGLHVISSIIDLCDRIDIYGFWPFPTFLDGNAVAYHYHNKVNGTAGAHSFVKEFKALVLLHERGIIRLHLGSCSHKNPSWEKRP